MSASKFSKEIEGLAKFLLRGVTESQASARDSSDQQLILSCINSSESVLTAQPRASEDELRVIQKRGSLPEKNHSILSANHNMIVRDQERIEKITVHENNMLKMPPLETF